jgi:signal transduction histidine kinase
VALFVVLVPLALMLVFLASTYYWHSVGSKIGAAALQRTTSGASSIDHLTAARNHLREVDRSAADSIDALAGKRSIDLGPLRSASASLLDELQKYQATPSFPGERGLSQQLLERWRAVDAATASLSAALDRGDLAGAKRVRSEQLLPAIERLEQRIHDVTRFNAEQQHWFAHNLEDQRRRASRILWTFDAASIGFALLLTLLVVRSVRLQWQLTAERERTALQRAQDLARFSERLERLNAAAVSVSETIGEATQLEGTARVIVERARELTGADYAGLGFRRDPTLPFDPFVFSGDPEIVETPELLRRIPPPSLKGPFFTVRLMNDTPVGQLFLARRPGREPFDEQDERIARLLATHAAVSIENLRLYRAAWRAVRTRDDVLAVVSHDLKNPLSVIRMTADRLLHLAPGPEASTLARKEGERIARGAERMVRLINDLLDLARVESGVFHVRQQPEAAEALVADAIDLMTPLADQKSIRLSSDVTAARPIPCERELIARVFSNLIGNAIKFTSEGGSITVSARLASDEVRFSVTDTGCGIPEELRPHIFERFWQAEQDRRGTGLGLYISKGIVEAHGGRVGVESQLGVGTTVWFSLPLLTPAEIRPYEILH